LDGPDGVRRHPRCGQVPAAVTRVLLAVRS
jgi:hypothetical protein